MEVKIFTKILKYKQGFLPGSVTPSDCGLAAEVNLWLASKPDIKINNISQSQSGGLWQPVTIVLTVWYQ